MKKENFKYYVDKGKNPMMFVVEANDSYLFMMAGFQFSFSIGFNKINVKKTYYKEVKHDEFVKTIVKCLPQEKWVIIGKYINILGY